MARNNNKYPLIEALEIIDIAAEGKSIGKYNDLVVFVPMTIPGDIVDVQINNKRRRFMEGYVTRYIKHSELKCEPFCSNYGDCGGCTWQNLPYDLQLKYKQKQVVDQLERIGKIALPEINTIIGSEKTRYYRNKLDFAFSSKRWVTRSEIDKGEQFDNSHALGFHVSGAFDKILDIDMCHLQGEPSNEIRNEIRRYTIENDYSFYDVRSHEGFMRNVVIRTASTGDTMVIVIFAYEDELLRKKLLDHLKATFPQITSLIYIINEKLNDSYSDQDAICYAGNDHIMEFMEELKFKVGAKSFFQTNSKQAYELYKITRDAADLHEDQIVYDLYTGTGTIANFVAHRCKKVVGIEYVSEAIDDAKVNSSINSISNTVFYAGDMKKVLTDKFIAQNGKPDVIILDPPRAGVDPEVVVTILNAAPTRIVYVSCNPATQARDIALMDELYKVTKIQPVDMFPHTHHVENVVVLERR
ncbi:MAG: 23S rRNA (uracil(1939)-C(5))-methyltransferase RlmD [Rikenellaceae bacterium]